MANDNQTKKKPFSIISSAGEPTTSTAEVKRPYDLDNPDQTGFVDPDDSYSDGRGGTPKKEQDDGDYGEDT